MRQAAGHEKKKDDWQGTDQSFLGVSDVCWTGNWRFPPKQQQRQGDQDELRLEWQWKNWDNEKKADSKRLAKSCSQNRTGCG